MTPNRITVLGGGNTAFSMAANLALTGFEVLLWEHPAFADTIEPIRESLTIHLVPESPRPGSGYADLRGTLRVKWGKTELTAPWRVD